jgi:hypothetical protein
MPGLGEQKRMDLVNFNSPLETVSGRLLNCQCVSDELFLKIA